MKVVEFRDRSQRAPGGDFRLFLGRPKNSGHHRALCDQKDTLTRLAKRDEWDVLELMKSGALSVEGVVAAIDRHGIDDYRSQLHRLRPVVHVPLLRDHVERWLEIKMKRGTHKVYKGHLKRLVRLDLGEGELGLVPWSEIMPHTIRDAKHEAGKGLEPNTIRTILGSWSAFFTWAIERDESEANAQNRDPVMIVNPVRRAKVWDPLVVTRHRFFSYAEYAKLLKVAPENMRAHYATLVLGGLRIDETFNLPLSHIHLPTHIHIGTWGQWEPKGYPRSEHGIRDVPIHRERLLPLLEEYAARWAGASLFFVNPDTGAMWSYNAFAKHFARDIEAAGMVAGQRRKRVALPDGVTPHTCRHTLASWLAQADIPLLNIALILGDTVETVRKHYAHLLPGDLDKTIQRLFTDPLPDRVPTISSEGA